jgi:hypothetical protein
VVGRDGIEPPTVWFQPGAANPDPSASIRLSRIRPGQQAWRRTCHPD